MNRDNKTNNVSNDAEVGWNLAAQQLSLIGLLMTKASLGYNNVEHRKWYYPLKSIRMQIYSRLSKEEIDDLHKQEKMVEYVLGITTNIDLNSINTTNEQKAIYFRRVKILNQLIEKYETSINLLLDKKGYLIPLKHDRTSIFNQADPDDEEGVQE